MPSSTRAEAIKILRSSTDPDAKKLIKDIETRSKKALGFSLKARGLGRGLSRALRIPFMVACCNLWI